MTSQLIEKPAEVHTHFGNAWLDCSGDEGVHLFAVSEYFAPNLTGPTHMLVCELCGTHLHADFVELAR
jgi:hypothetical protein